LLQTLLLVLLLLVVALDGGLFLRERRLGLRPESSAATLIQTFTVMVVVVSRRYDTTAHIGSALVVKKSVRRRCATAIIMHVMMVESLTGVGTEPTAIAVGHHTVAIEGSPNLLLAALDLLQQDSRGVSLLRAWGLRLLVMLSEELLLAPGRVTVVIGAD